MFSTDLYIKIYPNKIVARNISSGKTAEVTPESPYLHPRLLIGNIDSAERAMVSAMRLVRSSIPSIRVRILIHPIAEFPGGISTAEERLFRMLAFDARAGQVILWVGSELSDEQVLVKIRSAK